MQTNTYNLLEVLSSLESKGSGFGMSYYMTRCPRQANLDKEFGSGVSSYRAQVGTVFHKLEELYFTGKLENVVLPISDDPHDCKTDPVQEALRCFATYIQYFPKNEFNTIACELPFSSEECSPEQRKLIEDTVGVVPFTGRIDRVIYVTELQAADAKARRGIALRPGYYLVDTKTTEKRAYDAWFKYPLSPQFTGYQLVWQALNPTLKLNGLLVNCVIRHQDMTEKEDDGSLRSFRTYVIDYPSDNMATALRTFLPTQKLRILSNVCDITACADYGGCSHYKTGNCNRF